MAGAAFKAGYAEADITPPLGGSMPGYFRDRQATGVLDPLKAKVLHLEQGGESVALVACDLIGMAASFVKRIREAIARSASPPKAVWIHCTHTHTGGLLPRGDGFTSDAESIYPGFYQGKVDENWTGRLVENVARAVTQAAKEAKAEFKLTLHEGRQNDIAHYRRYIMKDGSVRTNPGRKNPNVVRPAGEIDPRVHVLRFASNQVVMVIYGLHPDCVGGAQYSADYPHHLTETLRHALGVDWRVIFLNACCGNINHVNVNDPQQKSGYEESRRIGEALALAVLDALKKERPLSVDSLSVRGKTVMCPLRKPRPEDVKEAEEVLRTYKETGKNPFGFNELYAPAALVLERTKDKEHAAEIVALRLGRQGRGGGTGFGLAAMPGEVFVELAREVAEAVPFEPTRVIGLTNGAMGYIPTRRGFAEGGYEAGYRSARYQPETGHAWARVAAELLAS